MSFFTKIPNVVVPIVGTAITHGLSDYKGVLTPDEYHAVPKAAPPAAPYFFSSTPADSTNVYISAGSTQTVDLFIRYNHSVIR